METLGSTQFVPHRTFFSFLSFFLALSSMVGSFVAFWESLSLAPNREFPFISGGICSRELGDIWIITFDQIFRYTFSISESADGLINRSLRSSRQVFFFTNKHGILIVDISTMKAFQLRVIPRRGDDTGSPSPNLVASDRELIIVSSLNPTRSVRNKNEITKIRSTTVKYNPIF